MLLGIYKNIFENFKDKKNQINSLDKMIKKNNMAEKYVWNNMV